VCVSVDNAALLAGGVTTAGVSDSRTALTVDRFTATFEFHVATLEATVGPGGACSSLDTCADDRATVWLDGSGAVNI
jgi:hypothetical protein